MKKWSEEAWYEVAGIYKSILRLPFVKELADGSLSADRFGYYIGQDALYLDDYSQTLSHIASRLQDKDHVESFLKFALEGIEVERQLHASYLKKIIVPQMEKSPTCLLYTSLERAQALSPVEVEAAAVLPCFLIYQRVGDTILKQADLLTNPYAEWISTYADKAFEESTHRAVEICDQLAANTTDAIRHRMTDIFVKSTRLEWMFWQSAYEMEKWKI